MRTAIIAVLVLLCLPAVGQSPRRLEGSEIVVGDEAYQPLLLRGFFELGQQTFAKPERSQHVALIPEKALTKDPSEVEFDVSESIRLPQYENRAAGLIAYSIAMRHQK